MYKSPLERIEARRKARRLTKALEYFLDGLLAFMVVSAFIIWIVTLHWLNAPV
jgi:hypothetical protein